MKIAVVNRQRAARPDGPRLRRFAAWVMATAAAAAARPGRRWDAVDILLVGDAGIVEAKRATFGRRAVTDVVSQPYRPAAPGGGWSGDVVVNVEQALREGARRPGGPARELARYIAHGCQHLAGASDRTRAGRAAMARRECAWLRAAGREGFLDHLLAGVTASPREAGGPGAEGRAAAGPHGLAPSRRSGAGRARRAGARP